MERGGAQPDQSGARRMKGMMYQAGSYDAICEWWKGWFAMPEAERLEILKDRDYRKRLAELMDEIATLRGEVRFLLDHVGGLENASGLRLEDEDRRRYEAIAERYWGVIPD
jgi:hypothetical protein